ncbi:MAG: hypothetical protein KC492_37210, partial [Myxococcales bacterium]|nr:hypothetical protein [Myxococcales bacterium]
FESTDLVLDERGSVSVERGIACDSELAADLLRESLGELLGVSRPLPPALLRATRKSSDVADLIRELEAALIPVNRAAAKRALSRLYREVVLAEQTVGAREVRKPAATARRQTAPKARRREREAAPERAPRQVDNLRTENHRRQSATRQEPSSHVDEARPLREPQPADYQAARTDPAPPRWERDEVSLPPPPRVPELTYPGLDQEPEEVTAPQPVVARRIARQIDEDSEWLEATSEGLVFAEGDATERVPAVTADPFSVSFEDESEAVASPEPVEVPEPVPCAPVAAGSSRVRDRRSDVSELLSGFQVAETRSDEELSRALKAMVGLDLTPIAPEYR